MTLQEAKDLLKFDYLKYDKPQQWADLGSGNGLFSKALLDLLPKDSIVYAVDKKGFQFADQSIRFIKTDFEHEELALPPLHGIIMANSLHFIKNKLALLKKLKKYLLPGATFILIEYDTDNANRWVPFPLSFNTAILLFSEAGLGELKRISERQSVFNASTIYAAYTTV